MLAWIAAHPLVLASIAIVACATILDRVIAYYGDDHPKLAKALRFAIDLLSLLPSRGAPFTGVQLPLIHWTGPAATRGAPAQKSDDKGSASVGLLLILLALSGLGILLATAGCGSWKATGRAALQVASQTAYTVAQRADDACVAEVPRCLAEKHKAGGKPGEHFECAKLKKCWAMRRTAVKAALAVQAAVVAGLRAIDVADRPALETALKLAQDTLQPATAALAAYGVRLP